MTSLTTNDFKESQCGFIPIEWNVRNLADAVIFTKKPRVLDLSQLKTIPFVSMEYIPNNSVSNTGFIPKPPKEINSGTYCERGDILLAKITPSFENGKQAILNHIPEDFAYATTEVYAFKPLPTVAETMFLFYYFRLPSIRMELAAQMEGTTGRQRISKNVIEECLVVLPPLAEQRRIAAVLNTIQDAIAAQEDVIAAARAFKRSLMQRLFTYGPGREPAITKETLYGEVPEHWESLALNDCAKVQTGIAKGRRYEPGVKLVEIPYLRVANVQDGFLDLSEIKSVLVTPQEVNRYHLEIGDVLMTEGGDFDKLGRGFIWNGEIDNCIHQNHVFAVRANREILNPEFLTFLSQSAYGKSYFLTVAHRTTNLASINSTKLKAFPVMLPSKHEQEEIVQMLKAADKKIAAEEDRKAALQSFFQSTLHQLMTGQVQLLSDE